MKRLLAILSFIFICHTGANAQWSWAIQRNFFDTSLKAKIPPSPIPGTRVNNVTQGQGMDSLYVKLIRDSTAIATTFASATSQPIPSTIMKRSATANVQANEMENGILVTMASAGTLTLTTASAPNQVLTGSTTHTYILPNATTCHPGHWYWFSNHSTGMATVKDGSGTTLFTLLDSASQYEVLSDSSTTAGVWQKMIPTVPGGSGTNILPLNNKFTGLDSFTNTLYTGSTVFVPAINNFSSVPSGDTVFLTQIAATGEMVTVPFKTMPIVISQIAPGTAGQIHITNTTPSSAWVTPTGDWTINSTGVATLKNTGTAGTYTKTTYDAQGRETSGTSAVLASSDYANQGAITTILHGNAAGNPSFGQIVNADISNGTIDVTTKITGVQPLANGGTGSATQNFIDLTTTQTAAGDKTFSSSVSSPLVILQGVQTIVPGSVSGSATFSMSFRGNTKIVTIYLSALNGTAAYTFPVAYTQAGSTFGSTGTATTSTITTAITVTGVGTATLNFGVQGF